MMLETVFTSEVGQAITQCWHRAQSLLPMGMHECLIIVFESRFSKLQPGLEISQLICEHST